ncbi:MAG: hypothetical protein PHH28_11470 [Desulfuromonadaceae bacterium]|nr:hypothetical protein [Desulfuromonadaceae bacterium]
MRILRKAIKNVAIMMLMVILITPAAVHAHTLELLGAETTHTVGGGCHDADHDADQDSTGNHQSDVRCCELDTPYVLPCFQSLATPAVTGRLTLSFSSRQLDGYFRRIYRPPR